MRAEVRSPWKIFISKRANFHGHHLSRFFLTNTIWISNGPWQLWRTHARYLLTEAFRSYCFFKMAMSPAIVCRTTAGSRVTHCILLQVKHLGHLRALFEEIIEFTRSAEEPDPHQKPMLLANSYTYDEVLKAQFRCEKDPLYRTETAVAVPNQVREFDAC